MERKSYHDTTNVGFTALTIAERNAKKQEDIVLAVYMKERAYLSPDFVWIKSGLFNQDVPLTSVRRAITNLTAEGKLVKSERKTRGRYGKAQHTWVYVGFKEQDPQVDFLTQH